MAQAQEAIIRAQAVAIPKKDKENKPIEQTTAIDFRAAIEKRLADELARSTKDQKIKEQKIEELEKKIADYASDRKQLQNTVDAQSGRLEQAHAKIRQLETKNGQLRSSNEDQIRNNVEKQSQPQTQGRQLNEEKTINGRTYKLVTSGKNVGKYKLKYPSQVEFEGKLYDEWVVLADINLEMQSTGNQALIEMDGDHYHYIEEGDHKGVQIFLLSYIPANDIGFYVQVLSGSSIVTWEGEHFVKWSLRRERMDLVI